MRRPAPSRKQEILHSIVRTYIETGEPVASHAITLQNESLSPASIRHVMAELTEEGCLSQPHTSAGRLPTALAFRSYVKSLQPRRPAEDEVERLRAEMLRIGTLEERVGHSSHLLSEMTHNFSIAAAFPDSGRRLEQIELVRLSERRVLVVLITADRLARDRVVTLDEPVTLTELVSIRNYINYNFTGWTLSSIRTELEERLKLESAAYDAILKKLAALYAGGMLEVALTPEVHAEGVSNLVGAELHLTRTKMRELFRALEEKKRILQLLNRFLEQPAGELACQVGLDEIHPSMKELSFIGLAVELPGGIKGKVAVLGPMRMRYPKVMSAVLQVGEALRSVPS